VPVFKCSNGKYRIGNGPCVFTSREKAETAMRAYYARVQKGIEDEFDTFLAFELPLLELTGIAKAKSAAMVEVELSNLLKSRFNNKVKGLVERGNDFFVKRGKGKVTKTDVKAYMDNFETEMATLSPKLQRQVLRGVRTLYGLGAANASSKFGLGYSLSLMDEAAINWAAKDNLYWVGNFYSKNLSKQLRGITTQLALKEGLGRNEAGPVLGRAINKFINEGPKEFTGFRIPKGWIGTPDQYWSALAGHIRGLSTTWGSLSSFQQVGILYFTIIATGDERMCPVCGLLDGQVYPVNYAVQLRDQMMQAESPEAVKSLNPWMKAGEIEDIVGRSEFQGTKLNADEVRKLIDSGVVFPPFHFRCRCDFEASDQSEVQEVYGKGGKGKSGGGGGAAKPKSKGSPKEKAPKSPPTVPLVANAARLKSSLPPGNFSVTSSTLSQQELGTFSSQVAGMSDDAAEAFLNAKVSEIFEGGVVLDGKHSVSMIRMIEDAPLSMARVDMLKAAADNELKAFSTTLQTRTRNLGQKALARLNPATADEYAEYRKLRAAFNSEVSATRQRLWHGRRYMAYAEDLRCDTTYLLEKSGQGKTLKWKAKYTKGKFYKQTTLYGDAAERLDWFVAREKAAMWMQQNMELVDGAPLSKLIQYAARDGVIPTQVAQDALAIEVMNYRYAMHYSYDDLQMFNNFARGGKWNNPNFKKKVAWRNRGTVARPSTISQWMERVDDGMYKMPVHARAYTPQWVGLSDMGEFSTASAWSKNANYRSFAYNPKDAGPGTRYLSTKRFEYEITGYNPYKEIAIMDQGAAVHEYFHNLEGSLFQQEVRLNANRFRWLHGDGKSVGKQFLHSHQRKNLHQPNLSEEFAISSEKFTGVGNYYGLKKQSYDIFVQSMKASSGGIEDAAKLGSHKLGN